jgi:hypothetical protein
MGVDPSLLFQNAPRYFERQHTNQVKTDTLRAQSLCPRKGLKPSGLRQADDWERDAVPFGKL